MTKRPIRIANVSGFYGDRFSAAREQLDGGEVDVLAGDYLAEITMMILARARARDPALGYARSFVRQMDDVLATCLERGVKVVANAGGLNPAGCRDAVLEAARRQGLEPRVAIVEGDDVLEEVERLRRAGATRESASSLAHLETGAPIPADGPPLLSANAYLGAWGIRSALDRGADVVITGRVTDSALTLGPAAWHFGWADDDWDRLAGAIAAGHVIECSTQATGGNYAFLDEVGELADMGFPIAEVAEDGSFVVTKHPGTGGAVTVDTVKAQLLYEIEGPAYATPDVTARFDTVAVEAVGPDRVEVTGARGTPPPGTLKVSAHHLAGYRNHVDVLTGGLDADRKADRFAELFWQRAGGRDAFAQTRVDRFVDARRGTVYLRFGARDPSAERVGADLNAAAIDLVLASIPGITLARPPGKPMPCGATWPMALARDAVTARVTLGNDTWDVPCPALPAAGAPGTTPANVLVDEPTTPALAGEMISVPLGELVGARSGDKGPHANVGVWVRDPALYGWLERTLTVRWVRDHLPEPFDGPIERHALPNLHALNFVLRGYLGEGAMASIQIDNQAKMLGEQLRARTVDVDRALLDLARRDGGRSDAS